MKLKIKLAAAGILLQTILPVYMLCAEENISIYGYLSNYFQSSFTMSGSEFEEPGFGNTLLLRLKGDWNPEENLAFHLEIAHYSRLGNQNPYALYESLGIEPGEIEIDELVVDHAWGLANLGPLDLQFGKVPIGWGTGYVFNPTARTAAAGFFDTVNEETPGTMSLVPSLYFGDNTLTGYMAFQDRSGKTIAAYGDDDGENLPFGLKVQTIAASFDISLGFIKEVLYLHESGFRRNYYLSFDVDGGIGDLGLYAEAALKTPREIEGFFREDFDLEESLEVAAGCYYPLPLVAADLRLEYFHQGCGRSETSSYDVSALLSGEQVMLAEDYLFLHLEKELIDYLKSGLGGIVNLNDGSLVIYPELSYEVFNNLQFSLGAFLFFGDSESEFNGEFSFDGNDIDLTETFSLYGLCKISF